VGLIERAADYRWSSAGAYVSGQDASGLLDLADRKLRAWAFDFHRGVGPLAVCVDEGSGQCYVEIKKLSGIATMTEDD
jgi:hypothetical protein